MTKDRTPYWEGQKRYVGRVAIQYSEAMQLLRNGRVMGSESDGWRNVAAHCLYAGIISYTLGQLLGLSQEQIDHVTETAFGHDWDKRVEKETARKGESKDKGGNVLIEYDPEIVLAHEASKNNGLIRVTGDDVRDFETWGIEEKILRYADSSIGNTQEGKVAILPWRERMDGLRRAHPEIDIKRGMELYGIPLYDKLSEVTAEIEKEFYERLVLPGPILVGRYPSPEYLTAYIVDTIFDHSIYS